MNKKLKRLIQPGLGLCFAVMALFAAATAAFGSVWLAGAEAVAAAALFVYYIYRRNFRRKELEEYLRSLNDVPDEAKQGKIALPMLVANVSNGGILWTNDRFSDLSGFQEKVFRQDVQELIPGFNMDWLVSGKSEYPYDVRLGGRRCRVYGNLVPTGEKNEPMLCLMYFVDLTELYQVRDEYVRSRPVVSIILLDNYEELTKNLSESAISTLNASLDRCITAWAESYHGLLRKLERSRYLFIFERRDLDRTIRDKFSLLEKIREITNPAGLEATISFGLGVDGADYEESYSFASLSIEMALSRGGDQAVIKDRLNFNFYGGHTQETGSRSKVRSRVTANSLMELIGQSSAVFIMGHKNADMDAVGAAVGIRSLCRKKGKKSYIVLDLERNASVDLITELRRTQEYENAFISGQEALLLCDSKSILVIVDTNRPDQVEFKPLLETISKVCVVDHHRRAADYIDPVVVALHETAASSASELSAELVQYSLGKDDLLPIEAKAMLAGIFLDTKSFHVRTSESTFEAAAFLRRMGADTVEVKKLLQNDFQDTIAKYQIVRSARLYRQEIAIAALNTGTSRTLAAQAADELLNISGITASFVLYPQDNNEVVISARSIGDANVQVILEALGGGGNAATAGAQIRGSTVKETLDRLIASIDQYYEG